MIGETIFAGTLARCKQAYNWRDNISLIIGWQSASWWSVNIYCANCWPAIGAPILVTPILAQSSAVSFNSANLTWDTRRWRCLRIRDRETNIRSYVIMVGLECMCAKGPKRRVEGAAKNPTYSRASTEPWYCLCLVCSWKGVQTRTQES